jgi:hypothetical protein
MTNELLAKIQAHYDNGGQVMVRTHTNTTIYTAGWRNFWAAKASEDGVYVGKPGKRVYVMPEYVVFLSPKAVR